jgi:hypothetical protein
MLDIMSDVCGYAGRAQLEIGEEIWSCGMDKGWLFLVRPKTGWAEVHGVLQRRLFFVNLVRHPHPHTFTQAFSCMKFPSTPSPSIPLHLPVDRSY